MARRGSCLVNLLTLMVLLATCLTGAAVAVVAANPNVPFLNPFPPPTLPPIAVLPSPTATSTESLFPTFPPTWTTTFTPSPTATFVPITESPTRQVAETPSETATLDPNLALTPSPTGPTPTPSRTRSPFPFTVQGNGPVAVQNFANSSGCNWMGIGGQAFNLENNPIVGLIVHLESSGLTLDAITGSKTAYGAGGYEIALSDRAVQTVGEYTVQLQDANGSPLSDVIVVNTFADCTKNLLLVNFVQNH